MKEIYYKYLVIMALALLNSCCSESDNFLPDGSLDEDVHEILMEKVTKKPNVNLPFFKSAEESVYFKFDSFSRVRQISYFESSETLDSFLLTYNSSFTSVGFDFENYILVPVVDYDSLRKYTNTTYLEYQAKCFIYHRNKEMKVLVNTKSESCAFTLNSKERERFYFSWFSIPKLPVGYSLKIGNE